MSRQSFTSILSLFILLIFSNELLAQKTIKGRVYDAKTGETLPSANISIEGTYNGTISNVDGNYTLTIKSIPATVVVRYIGFETIKREITDSSDEIQDFELVPIELELQEIIVTGEDPAISIMKEVIRRKQIWRAKIETYIAEAYTRQRLANDTSIVSISESISQAFWDKEKGHREVMKSRRQTANIDGSDNFAGVSYLPNFYDDNLEIAGFDVVGVTNPKALSYYTFKLVDYQMIDDIVVYEISVSPKRKLQPLFTGTIYVLDEQYALLSVKLKPNRVVTFPPPVQEFDLAYEQQFNNYGQEFWLPVDFRLSGTVKVGIVGLRFPPITFNQISRISDYQVNVDLPDSLYNDNDLFSIDSTSIDNDSLFVSNTDVVPLSNKEMFAYETLDSTATLENAFRPKGFLARFIDDDDGDDEGYTVSSDGGSSSGTTTGKGTKKKQNKVWRAIRQGTSLDARFNRVDLLYAGAKYRINYADNRLRTEAFGGYSFGYDEAGYGGKVSWWPLKNTRRFGLSSEYYAKTERRYQSDIFNSEISSLTTLLGRVDYFDFYRSEGFALNAAYRFRRSNLTSRFRLVSEEHSSIDFQSNYNLVGRDINQRINPAIDEGYLRSAKISLISSDGNEEAMGVIGSRSYKINAEFAGDYLGSDFSFAKYDLTLLYNVNTFYKRRLFPNTLDFKIVAGTSTGELPFQRYGIIDGSPGSFTPFGVFKTIGGVPFEGEHYAAVFAEHNFRTVPFEILGLNFLVDQGIGLIAFGGVGQSWISDSRQQEFNTINNSALFESDGIHSEMGISINALFSIARIDIAKRLDDGGYSVGFSVARWF